MAYIVGYVTAEERAELERRGWEVEEASRYNLVGDNDEYLFTKPDPEMQPVVIWVDSDLFEVMDGPDWEKGEEESETKRRDEKHGLYPEHEDPGN